jgi:hypothetical protein
MSAYAEAMARPAVVKTMAWQAVYAHLYDASVDWSLGDYPKLVLELWQVIRQRPD